LAGAPDGRTVSKVSERNFADAAALAAPSWQGGEEVGVGATPNEIAPAYTDPLWRRPGRRRRSLQGRVGTGPGLAISVDDELAHVLESLANRPSAFARCTCSDRWASLKPSRPELFQWQLLRSLPRH